MSRTRPLVAFLATLALAGCATVPPGASPEVRAQVANDNHDAMLTVVVLGLLVLAVAGAAIAGPDDDGHGHHHHGGHGGG